MKSASAASMLSFFTVFATTDAFSLLGKQSTRVSTKDAFGSAALTTLHAATMEDSATLAGVADERMEEDSKFDCDDRVQFWKDYQNIPPEQAPGFLSQLVGTYLFNTGTDTKSSQWSSLQQQQRAYWLYHTARSGYFSTNAVVGTLAHVAHERIIRQSSQVANIFDKPLDKLLILLAETFLSYEQDWKWIEQGVLNYPWDAAIQVTEQEEQGAKVQWNNHKQSNPFFALQETSRLVRESIGVWGRRVKGSSPGVWLDPVISSSSTSSSDVTYPDYYLNDFHFQTDGWMSSESADRYDVGTETLFLGRQDAMQRQTLVPLKKYFQQQSKAAAFESILEVACGTGRFATFTCDNFPTSNMTLVDLSPFYLEKARENIQYWRSKRGEQALQIAQQRDNTLKTTTPAPTNFVQANAEKLPFPDNSFQAVTCVYLFHELPPQARANAAAEMVRVCQPGGIIVLSDSFQVMDRPFLATNVRDFGKLNEPYFESYVEEDLPALFEKHGVICGEKYMNSRTKTLSFIKKNSGNAN